MFAFFFYRRERLFTSTAKSLVQGLTLQLHRITFELTGAAGDDGPSK
jgi:hypothetical protein